MSETAKGQHTPGPWEVRDIAGAGLQIWAKVDLGPAKHEANDIRAEARLEPIYEVSINPSLMIGDDGIAYAMIAYESWRQFPSVNFEKMQQANAALIASAPEMKQALQGLAEALRKILLPFPSRENADHELKVKEDIARAALKAAKPLLKV